MTVDHSSKRSGEISVEARHIFPIIRKWLYSDEDIFVRELVSNASDAIRKYEQLIQISEAEEIEELRALAFWMSLKTAILGLPLGGGKGGIAIDPALYSEAELTRLTRAFVEAIHLDIGPDRDIPAPDVNTNAQTMAVFADAYGKLNRKLCPVRLKQMPRKYCDL